MAIKCICDLTQNTQLFIKIIKIIFKKGRKKKVEDNSMGNESNTSSETEH